MKKIKIDIVGIKGDRGDTPKKGVHYFTKEEQNQFVSKVLGQITLPKVDYKKVESFVKKEIAKIPKPKEAKIDIDSIVATVLLKVPEQPNISEIVREEIKKLDLDAVVEGNRRLTNSAGPRTRLEEMVDVTTTDLAVNDVLQWNGTEWVNAQISSGGGTWGSMTGTLADQVDLQTALNDKQDTLVSATNIKTINGVSILGAGNMSLPSYANTVGTEAVILASTPTVATLAYATDTLQIYVFDGTNWRVGSSYFAQRNANPNMGALQEDNSNDVGTNFIANKRLSNIKMGSHPATPARGSLKGDDDTDTADYEMSIWSTVSSKWRRLLAGIALRNDTVNQALVTDDFSYFTINLFTGDSLELDGAGTPMVQRGKISIGAVQRPPLIVGGSF